MPKPRNNAERWRRLLGWLRTNFPANHPITVRSKRHMADQDRGGTELFPRGFLIEVESATCWEVRFDTILHEWAHAMVWEGAETLFDDHSNEWGIAYARLYREFYLWKWGVDHGSQ